MTTRFSCTGCGKCCTDHHVPLTLDEARAWAEDGGQIMVLLEAFLHDGAGPKSLRLEPGQQEHARRRSLPVLCGTAPAYVSITFAAHTVGRCRNLQEDNRCAIYTERPLVCRIYPMEINPHIPLRPEAKDCPSLAWEDGPVLIQGGQLKDRELQALIEQSRQADRDEIAAKAWICTFLGIRTAALKGDGFTTYLPDMQALSSALRQVRACSPAQIQRASQDWSLHVPDPLLAERLAETGAMLEALLDNDGVFISLRRAAA
jgi:Fe-S-cluster containining protein